jgi:hypothetical protein
MSDGRWSPLHSATLALNEMFVTLCNTGFTESQALRLIAFLIEDMQMDNTTDD